MRAVQQALGMREESACAAVFPFAGGFGGKQETCGALVAGAMCLGMASSKFGRAWDEFNEWDNNRILEALGAVSLFYDRCREAMGGTVNCREITWVDLKTLEDAEQHIPSGGFERCCRNCGEVARIVVETLLE